MKIYTYWATGKARVSVGNEEKEIKCYGGSNLSEDDALIKAEEKIEKIKNRIAGHPHVFDDYQVEIREEIVRKINENAAITRNRYGAQILNIEDQMILDIDRPRFSFWDWFKKQTSAKSKAKIIDMVRTLSKKPIYQGCTFRIYETHKGIRVIVPGKKFDPKSAAVSDMMKEFNCDALYALLCKKQDCFRARLTPKASRMKLRGHKVTFPRNSEEEEKFRNWLREYETTSQNFSVCKFIEQIGPDCLMTEAVQLHDEITGAHHNQKLA